MYWVVIQPETERKIYQMYYNLGFSVVFHRKRPLSRKYSQAHFSFLVNFNFTFNFSRCKKVWEIWLSYIRVIFQMRVQQWKCVYNIHFMNSLALIIFKYWFIHQPLRSLPDYFFQLNLPKNVFLLDRYEFFDLLWRCYSKTYLEQL